MNWDQLQPNLSHRGLELFLSLHNEREKSEGLKSRARGHFYTSSMALNPDAPPFQMAALAPVPPDSEAQSKTKRRKGRGRGRGRGRGSADDTPAASSTTPKAPKTRVCRYDRLPTGCTKAGCAFVHNNARPNVVPAQASQLNGSQASTSAATATEANASRRDRSRGRSSRNNGAANDAPIVLLQRGQDTAATPTATAPQPKQQRKRRQRNKPSQAKPVESTVPPTPPSLLTPANGAPDQHDLSASITAELDKERYECMICLDRIRRRAAIWNCGSCYRVLHLECARRWGKTSSQQGENTQWQCPGCRAEIHSLPKAYFCFCGQTKQPQDDGYTHAHSCGEVCGGKRPGCKHACNEPCHAGPHPTCALTVSLKCHCGKQTSKLRCNKVSDAALSCGKVCKKRLICGLHKCQKECHAGACQRCDETVVLNCYCGQHQQTVVCGSVEHMQAITDDLRYSCNQRCNQPLACGSHHCERICHPDACYCPYTPERVTTCPCGRVPLRMLTKAGVRQSCSDPIPTCLGRCRKSLDCGHSCQATCHQGACPPCEQPVELHCRCSSQTTTAKCGARAEVVSSLECERICGHLLTCGRHRCSTVCCPARTVPKTVDVDAHACMQLCGRTLACGCECDLLCHRGRCPTSCGRISREPLTCYCGAAVLNPPIRCGTQPPECQQPCTRPRDCSHPANHQCHSEGDCPPCVFFVNRPCASHQAMISGPCHKEQRLCAERCLKPMPCGDPKHRCQAFCHPGSCTTATLTANPALKMLKKPEVTAWGEEDTKTDGCCMKCCQRRLCGHECGARCHPGVACPATACRVRVTRTCACGHRTTAVPCGYGDSALAAQFQQVSQALQDAHAASSAEAKAASTPQPSLTSLVKLPCNGACKRYQEELARRERNARLAASLQIMHKPTEGELVEEYSEFLVVQARRHPALIAEVEALLTSFVRSTIKEKRLRVMKRDERQVVHELAEHYGLASESQDPEPQRNVVLYRGVIKAAVPKIPKPTLSEYMRQGPGKSARA
eukprot:m.134146 g.134146  ORF g.134146 m.134146 type:complete len:1015 (+) comp15971_c0_seq6:732-3776(+)